MARTVAFIPREKVKQALRVFCRQGYHATSVQDLVEAMQINRSSLYNSFKDKHNLFLECLRSYAEAGREDYEALTRGDSHSALQTIDLIIDHMVGVTVGRADPCIDIKSCFELAGENPEVQDVLKKSSMRTIMDLRYLLEVAAEAGEMAPQRDPQATASYIFSSFSGWHQSYLLFQDPHLIRTMAELLKASLRRMNEGRF